MQRIARVRQRQPILVMIIIIITRTHVTSVEHSNDIWQLRNVSSVKQGGLQCATRAVCYSDVHHSAYLCVNRISQKKLSTDFHEIWKQVRFGTESNRIDLRVVPGTGGFVHPLQPALLWSEPRLLQIDIRATLVLFCMACWVVSEWSIWKLWWIWNNLGAIAKWPMSLFGICRNLGWIEASWNEDEI